MATTFAIKNYKDYYNHLLLIQYEEFMTSENYNSSRHAMIYAIFAYHLREWIWKCEPNKVKKILLNSKKIKQNQLNNDDYIECKFNEYINQKCPEIQVMREICNGTKHLLINNKKVKNSSKRNGAFSGGFNGCGFQTHDLIYIDENGNTIIFKTKCISVMEFWKQFIYDLENITP